MRTIARAEAAYPVPQPDNFPTRKSLVRWLEAQDCDVCPAYTYLFNDTLGEPLFYFVFENRPVSTCTFLTTPQRFIKGDKGQNTGDFLVQAPALDGVYYGSGGQCDQQFAFEAASGAMIEFNGALAVTSNQPLSFASRPLRVVGTLGSSIPDGSTITVDVN